MTVEPLRTETDVLVIGSGAAGMYAAIEAAKSGCKVLLVDRSLIGRGGATVMAQMTVAVALGAETPDDWHYHYKDTLALVACLNKVYLLFYGVKVYVCLVPLPRPQIKLFAYSL